MTRIHGRLTALAALALLPLTAGTAAAQGGGVGGPVRPTTSPYLNLLRRTSNVPGVNYYGIVRPELQTRSALQNLQQQVTTNREAVSGLTATSNLPQTGVVGSFLNTGGYFMNMSGGGQGGSGQAGAARFGTGGANRGSTPGRR